MANSHRNGPRLWPWLLASAFLLVALFVGSDSGPSVTPTPAPDDSRSAGMSAASRGPARSDPEGAGVRRELLADATVQDTREVVGRVVRARDGQPVPDAEVALEAGGVDSIVHLDPIATGQRHGLAVVHSAADGTFRLAVEPAAGMWLQVRKDGHGTRVQRVDAGSASQLVLLDPESVVYGVVNDTGVPVADAPVLLRAADSGQVLRTMSTDAAGRYRFGALGVGQLIVEVLDPRHSLVRERVQSVEGLEVALDLDVGGGEVVKGIVVDRTSGRGIAGARVADVWNMARCAVTDALGEFRLGGVRQGQHALYVTHADYADREVALRRSPGVLRVTLDLATMVTGRAVDASARGVGGAYVALAPTSPRQGRWTSTRTDASGRFALPVPATDDSWTLIVSDTGRAAVERLVPEFVAGQREVAMGDLTLVPECVMSVRIVDGMRRGVAFGRVRVESVRSGAAAASVLVREREVGPGGVAGFGGLQPGDFKVSWFPEGGTPVPGASVAVVGTRADVELQVDAGSSLSGHVHPWPLPSSGARGKQAYIELVAGAERRVAAVEADGSFEVHGMGPGPYALRFRGVPGWAEAADAMVEAGPRKLDVRVTALTQLQGRVVLPSGVEESRIRVSARLAGAAPRIVDSVVAAADGRFSLLVPDSYVGTVQARGEVSGLLGECPAKSGDHLTLVLTRPR